MLLFSAPALHSPQVILLSKDLDCTMLQGFNSKRSCPVLIMHFLRFINNSHALQVPCTKKKADLLKQLKQHRLELCGTMPAAAANSEANSSSSSVESTSSTVEVGESPIVNGKIHNVLFSHKTCTCVLISVLHAYRACHIVILTYYCVIMRVCKHII
jgi:hypothetical protein